MTRFPPWSACMWLPTVTAAIVLASGAMGSHLRSAEIRIRDELRSAAAGLHELVLHDP